MRKFPPLELGLANVLERTSSSKRQAPSSAGEWQSSAALRRADAARDARRWPEAAEAYRAVLTMHPESAAIWIQYGHALKELGNSSEACSAYERARTLDPFNYDSSLHLGHMLKIMGENSRAIAMYGEALRLNPASAEALRELQEIGARPLARAILREADLARRVARGLLYVSRPFQLVAGYLTRVAGLARHALGKAASLVIQGGAAVDLAPARAAIGRADWISAVRLLEYLQGVWPRNALITRELEHASLRGARELESSGRLLDACRLWVSYARATGDREKAARNIARCARNTTRGTSDRKSISEALLAWKCLAAIDAGSNEARHGIAWCEAGLARWAEQASDHAAAESHWIAYLRAVPGDPTGTDGLRKARAASVHDDACAPRAGTAGAISPSARLLYEHVERVGRLDYKSQYAAARLLHESEAPDLALKFAQRAFELKHTAEAAILVLQCHLARRDYQNSALQLQRLIEIVPLSVFPKEDCRDVLAWAAPPGMSRPALEILSRFFAGDSEMQSALMPHLIAADARDAVLTGLRQAANDDVWWTAQTLVAAAEYLWASDDRAAALGTLARHWGRSPEIKAHAAALIKGTGAAGMESLLQAGEIDPAESRGIALMLALRYAASGGVARALDLLEQGLRASEGRTPALRPEFGDLLCDTLATMLNSPASTPAIRERLAEITVSLLPADLRAFYAGSGFDGLRSVLAAAAAYEDAGDASRRGAFRERYFEHYLERREGVDPDSLTSDVALCDAAVRYFLAHAKARSVEHIPVPANVRARLTRPCLFLGDISADVLMTCAMMRDGPMRAGLSADLLAEIAGWYVSTYIPANHIPSACFSRGLVEYFTEETSPSAPFGVPKTRFLELMAAHSGRTRAYLLDNPLERLFFMLDFVATTLPKVHQYRVFTGPLEPREHAPPSFFHECLRALRQGSRDSLPAATSTGRAQSELLRKSQSSGVPESQEVMLIGHAAPGSGLGRNFRMLSEAIAANGAKLATLTFETEPEQFAGQLMQWAAEADSRSVAIIAVNAHDIPAVFAKDRHGVLNDRRVAGFLLWETSRVPRVQQLGIELLDEVWAPTRYVADVYAGLAPTHVVGKGLFSARGSPLQVPLSRPRSNPFQFVTVFDFHSSIERKNPLATVLAFKKAFRPGEQVELVVKASNVDPQHPSNALGQWERLCAASWGDKRIRIVTSRYTDEEMKQLISGAACVVSLHRSEGFGYLMSDAMFYGVPVIATGYSGNADFCSEETCFPVPYHLVPVKSQGAHWESDGVEWAEPHIDAAAEQMRRVFEDYGSAMHRAANGQRFIISEYSTERFAQRLQERIALLGSDAN